MKIKKKFCGPLLAALIMVSAALPVQAEDTPVDGGWQVEYRDGKLNSNFTETDIRNRLSEMQAGDTVTFKVVLRNGSGKRVNYYMLNEVLQSLEDGTKAAGGAYTYVLNYYDSKGAKTELFNNDSVGGDISGNDAAAKGRAADNRQGLHDEALNYLNQYLYLEELAAGSEGRVELIVGLDGETHRNAYMGKTAEIRLNFAVEEGPGPERVYETWSQSGGQTKRIVPGTIIEPEGTPLALVKTGDEARPRLWAAMMAFSAGALAVLLVFARKSRGKDGDRNA